MTILGIDPGCRFAGFGVIKKDGPKSNMIDHGVLRLSIKDPMHRRIEDFYNFFLNKIKEHAVTSLAIETPFMGKNAQNFLKLGQLRGILYLLASQHNLSLQEFAPMQIKQTLTGFGGAPKEQVAFVVKRLFPSIKVSSYYDETDAIAVTLCGLWIQKD